MRLLGLPASLVGRLAHPRTTVRWRLTLLYGGLFLISGAALLAITYTLVSHQLDVTGEGVSLSPTGGASHGGAAGSAAGLPLPTFPKPKTPAGIARILQSPTALEYLRRVEIQTRVDQLHVLEIWSGVALGVMALVSMLLGWVVAGRVLAPLRAITSTTQQISDTNLHRRLAIDGPRDELTQLADTIDGLLERLDVAFEAQRRFVANASHELRTPLATMRATLDVAVGKPHVPPQTQLLGAELREDLDEADRLLESFLTLARAQHGELGARASVPLAELAGDALAVRGDEISAKRLEARTALAPVCVTGSQTLLARMVDNVIENAVHHNQTGGLLNVELALDGETARLVVETDGQVLDQQRVAQLAQPFRRLGAERTGSQNGHGLGLSIVAAVAAAHGGTLELHARPQGGIRVHIVLPAASIAQPARVPA
jgi:signal transduction histidine kinase